MAEPATQPMTLDEFHRWNDGTDTHYELIGGFPVAMAPPAAAHRILSARMLTAIETVLSTRRPCNAQGDAGVTRPDRIDTYFEADIAATCERHDVRQQSLAEPFLIVEILSPSTERHDRRVKLPVYRQIDSIQEILFIDSDGIYAELHRRSGAQWIIEILRGGDAVLSLASVPIEIRLTDLYDGIALPDTAEE
jgi:Uma2 family endonuclease